jgi:hypothetical protein
MTEAEQKWLSDCFKSLSWRNYVTWGLLAWVLLKLYRVL